MELPWVVRRVIAANRRVWAIVATVASNTFRDGFVHAGNLAFLSMLTVFPAFIILAAIAGALGRTDDGLRAVNGFLALLPADVAALLAQPVADVIAGASARLLTFGIFITLWTVSGTIETIRDILRRAYGVEPTASFWRYRLRSIGIIFAAVLLMLFALAAQVVLTAVETFVATVLPDLSPGLLGIGRLVPAAGLLVSLYLIFYSLTPHRFRRRGFALWPGPLLTTVVWIGTTRLLPASLGLFGGYDLTYGSLAGVIVALMFFYIIGLGLVVGAQLNAALALTADFRQNRAVERATARS